MKKLIAAVVSLSLGGCLGLGMQTMSPDQIKATNGMATCTTGKTLYYSGSTVSINMDDVRKGATSKGKTKVTCGDTSMEIDTNVGVGVTPGVK